MKSNVIVGELEKGIIGLVRRTRLHARCAATSLGLALVLSILPAGLRASGPKEYVVGEGDTLLISVFGNPDLTTTARVAREGTIQFPLIGSTPAAGMTAAEIEAAISATLADGYIIDPQVSVSVQEYRTKSSSILGKVNRPGQYDFRGRLTLLELLSRAGGLAPDAGNQAVIKRKADSAVIKAGDLVVDLKELLLEGNIFRDVEIMDEDTVTVPEAGQVFLVGEVRRPGTYRFDEGMTLLRAVTLAGGFTERANTAAIKVIRSEDGQERVLAVGTDATTLETPMVRGDIVVVNEARAEVCYVTGEVKSAGAYRCDRDTTVLMAVTLAGGFTDAAAKNKIRIVRRGGGQEQVRDKVGLEEPLLAGDILIVPKSFF
jgi:polysaccharide export outer membrane protein